jgi:hypothetical protein
MAFAFWRILKAPETSERRTAIILFALVLILNAAWSWGQQPRPRPYQHRAPACDHWRDDCNILESGPTGFALASTAGGVGRFCSGAEFFDLASEQLEFEAVVPAVARKTVKPCRFRTYEMAEAWRLPK